jgi:NADP-dependent 3-hydroxy acid dehydrogenase YdfG
VALVTGASSGIGRAIALSLAARGHRLCLVGRNRERLEAVASAMEEDASWVEIADLTSRESRQAIVDSVERQSGSLQVLVHAAGVIELAESESDSGDGAEGLEHQTNYVAPRELTRLLLPSLIESRGEVVFVNSTAGLNPVASAAGYSASKQALRRFADELRGEVNAKGVRVLSIYPGRTATPMQAAIFEHEGRDYPGEKLLQPEDVAAMVVAALSLPRTAEVTDLMIRPMNKI